MKAYLFTLVLWLGWWLACFYYEQVTPGQQWPSPPARYVGMSTIESYLLPEHTAHFPRQLH